MAEIRSYTMNFGPQHPAAHGVLRLVLEMDGEVVQKADPHIGLLHRATEKLAEIEAVQPVDRLHGPARLRLDDVQRARLRASRSRSCSASSVPLRAQYIRVMFDEITRILNHLMWLGAHGLDIGAMTVFLYCFREREDLMDCYEAVSGTRMHATYYRPGGVYRDLPDSMPRYQPSRFRSQKETDRLNERRSGTLLDFIEDFTRRFPACVDEYETLLTDNRIWKQRTVNIGVVTPERALNLGFTGPDAARLRHRLGPAQEAAVRGLRPRWISTSRSASTATATTATSCASRKCASRTASSSNASTGCEQNPGPGDDRRPQDRAADSRGDEGRHGIADPSLQALHRGLLRAGGRVVRAPSKRPRASSASTSSRTAPTSRTG